MHTVESAEKGQNNSVRTLNSKFYCRDIAGGAIKLTIVIPPAQSKRRIG
jgi:hypothetical protein